MHASLKLTLAALPLFLASVSSAAFAAEPTIDPDVRCLASAADTKANVDSDAEKRGADLAMMYYLGRLRARLPAAEIAAQVTSLRREASEDQQQLEGRGCSAHFLAELIGLVQVNQALAKPQLR